MGLDLYIAKPDYEGSHARWNYTGFGRFRERLAEEIGIDLRTMSGYTSGGRPWSEVDDALVPLLNHSDCDGTLSASECEQVAPRLREIVGRWSEHDYDRQEGENLASMMVEAAEASGWVVFA